MIKQILSSTLIILLVFISFNNCATIMHGTSQDIGISSNPTGAEITIDGREYGKTPAFVDLKRGDNHIIKIELTGYEPYEITTTKSLSGWVLGNILFGGLIGLAVDAISGGIYKLTPDQIMAELRKKGAENFYKDGLFIAVVLEIGDNWEKIGQLKK